MAKFELSDEQAKQLIGLLQGATVRVSDAIKLLAIIKALENPISDPKK